MVMHWLHAGQWPVHIGFTTSGKAWRAECKRLGAGRLPLLLNGHASATTRILEKDGSPPCIVITAKKPSKSLPWEQYAALIAHEAVHVMQFLKQSVSHDIPLGDETEAYLVQYITQECLSIAYNTGRSISVQP